LSSIPVRTITETARRASEQHLGERLALTGPRDELKELADTFDAMLERLDRAFAAQRRFVANASHGASVSARSQPAGGLNILVIIPRTGPSTGPRTYPSTGPGTGPPISPAAAG